MKRAAVLALLLVALPARAQRIWQDYENTNGYTLGATSDCFHYSTATFDVACYQPDSTLRVYGSNVGLATVTSAGSCTNCNVTFNAFGQATLYSNGSGGLGGAGGGADALGHYVVTEGANAPVNATNLGAGSSGVLEQSVSAGVATISEYACGTDDVAVGAAGGGLVCTSSLTYSAGALDIATSDGSGYAVKLTQGADQQINKGGSGKLYYGTDHGSAACVYTNTATRSCFQAGGEEMFVNMSAPVTPGAGQTLCWADSTAKDWTCKNDAGTLTHGVQTVTATGGQALTAQAADGSWAKASFQAPLTACTDYVSLSCVSGATDIGGTNATPTVTGIESGATQRGSTVATEIATPAAPGVGKIAVYAGTQNILYAESPFGSTTHTVATTTCGTNTWGSSIDAFGGFNCTQPGFANLSGAATCSQVAGTTTLYDGGSCAGTPWSTSGTFANGQALVTSGGHITATNECNVFASCTAGGSLSGTYPNPTVASVACTALPAFTGGATTTAGSCALALDGPSVAAVTTKLTYALQQTVGSNTPNTWLLQGGPGLWSNGAVIEYPNNFKATRIQLIWYLRSNTVLTGTLSFFATKNGSGIGGTGFSVTSATSAGVHVGTNLPTSSTSSSDTYGLAFTTDASFSAASPASEFVTVQVLLLP